MLPVSQWSQARLVCLWLSERQEEYIRHFGSRALAEEGLGPECLTRGQGGVGASEPKGASFPPLPLLKHLQPSGSAAQTLNSAQRCHILSVLHRLEQAGCSVVWAESPLGGASQAPARPAPSHPQSPQHAPAHEAKLGFHCQQPCRDSPPCLAEAAQGSCPRFTGGGGERHSLDMLRGSPSSGTLQMEALTLEGSKGTSRWRLCQPNLAGLSVG